MGADGSKEVVGGVGQDCTSDKSTKSGGEVQYLVVEKKPVTDKEKPADTFKSTVSGGKDKDSSSIRLNPGQANTDRAEPADQCDSSTDKIGSGATVDTDTPIQVQREATTAMKDQNKLNAMEMEDQESATASASLIEKRLLHLIEGSTGKKIPLSTIPDLYKASVGSELSYKHLGYTKLMNFLSSLPRLAVEEGRRYDERYLILSPEVSTTFSRVVPEGRGSISSAQALEANSDESADTVSDLGAALLCLHALHRDYQERPWPSKSSKFTAFLKGLDESTDSRLIAWIKGLRDEGLENGKIRKQLDSQLVRMCCLSKKKGGKYSWNHHNVQAMLASHHSATEAGVTANTELTAPQALPILKSDNKSANTPIAGVLLVDTAEQLETLKNLYPFELPDSLDRTSIVAFDCEGVPENLFLIQIATLTTTYVFDCVKLDAEVVCGFLHDLLSDKRIVKLFHDLHKDAAALAEIGDINPICGTLDTQLAMELLTGELCMGFNHMLEELGQQQHSTKGIMKRRMRNEQLFAQRPLPPDVLQYAVDDVRLLVNAYEALCTMLGEKWESIQLASDARALSAAQTGGARRICFDVPNSYAISSFELLQHIRPDNMLEPTPLIVSDEASALLSLLPKGLTDTLDAYKHELSDVVLDKGRRPHAWVKGSRLLLGENDRVVESSEINAIVAKLGGFGSDYRAGLERQLHRISAIRNRESEIIGLTLRVGRHISGNTGIISDLLFGHNTKSILFLGEPGSGKTTVVREATRLLAERSNVCIVDTSNEIAGDGDIPHPCVGFARRMMVPSLDKQSAVMIECVQNHTPEVMVIDEIGRPTEVEAAVTCKNRGVRLIASAHGDLRKLIKNPKLRGLVGGIQSVILGDAQARADVQTRSDKPSGGIQKVKAERAGPPTFDVLVELSRGAHHEWRIVLNSADAVDSVLRGEAYKAQKRTRDPLTGAIHLEHEMA